MSRHGWPATVAELCSAAHLHIDTGRLVAQVALVHLRRLWWLGPNATSENCCDCGSDGYCRLISGHCCQSATELRCRPPEAEVVSGHHQCVLRELVFARGHVLWHVLPRDYVVLHEDKQAMIRVVRVCREPTLRYVLAQDPQELNGICVRSVCRCDGDQQTSKTWGQQDFMIWR